MRGFAPNVMQKNYSVLANKNQATWEQEGLKFGLESVPPMATLLNENVREKQTKDYCIVNACREWVRHFKEKRFILFLDC